jgi:signal transduction histidine kinase
MNLLIGHWAKLSLPIKFLTAGSVIMLLAMLFVGNWVSQRIEDAVVQNSAATVALYMDSFISPLSDELKDGEEFSEIVQSSLTDIFKETVVGDRVVSVKIWGKGGLIIYSSNEEIIGQTFSPSEELKAAWGGVVSGSFESLSHEESANEAELGFPLLEVYSPVIEPWTGKVIAVAEFYERADLLSDALKRAKWTSWLVVGVSFLTSGILLFGIVKAGGGTIETQQLQLIKQLEESKEIALQNVRLKQRVVDASGRATAQADKALRQLGSELHDGPAQYISLAALRLDSILIQSKKGGSEAEDIKHALNTALSEIRALSRGLAVPDLDSLDFQRVIERAIEDHNRHNNLNLEVPDAANVKVEFDYTSKLCVFRFLQETLSNSLKHASNALVEVSYTINKDKLTVSVSDNGPGFDKGEALRIRDDGGQGLLGLIDRAESIGGTLDINAKAAVGSQLILTLPLPNKESS